MMILYATHLLRVNVTNFPIHNFKLFIIHHCDIVDNFKFCNLSLHLVEPSDNQDEINVQLNPHVSFATFKCSTFFFFMSLHNFTRNQMSLRWVPLSLCVAKRRDTWYPSAELLHDLNKFSLRRKAGCTINCTFFLKRFLETSGLMWMLANSHRPSGTNYENISSILLIANMKKHKNKSA